MLSGNIEKWPRILVVDKSRRTPAWPRRFPFSDSLRPLPAPNHPASCGRRECGSGCCSRPGGPTKFPNPQSLSGSGSLPWQGCCPSRRRVWPRRKRRRDFSEIKKKKLTVTTLSRWLQTFASFRLPDTHVERVEVPLSCQTPVLHGRFCVNVEAVLSGFETVDFSLDPDSGSLAGR